MSFTKQQTFDMVVAHARRQKVRCTDPTAGYANRCVYRGDNNTERFVGALIPDDWYHTDLEGCNADENPVADLLIQLGHDPDFCQELQPIHDNIPPEKWEEAFQGAAIEHGFAYTPPA